MTSIKPLAVIAFISLWIIAPKADMTIFGQTTSTVSTAKDTTTTTSPESLARSMVEVLAQTLGPLFILGWYLYRHETKTLPDKDRQVAAAQESFSQELEKIRLAHEKTIDSLVAQNQKNSDMVLAIVQKCPGYTA